MPRGPLYSGWVQGVGEAPLKGTMLNMVAICAIKEILLSIHGETSIEQTTVELINWGRQQTIIIIIETSKVKIIIKEKTIIVDTMNGVKSADETNVDQKSTLQQRPPEKSENKTSNLTKT